MKNIKKLSLALLLSVASSQFMTAMHEVSLHDEHIDAPEGGKSSSTTIPTAQISTEYNSYKEATAINADGYVTAVHDDNPDEYMRNGVKIADATPIAEEVARTQMSAEDLEDLGITEAQYAATSKSVRERFSEAMSSLSRIPQAIAESFQKFFDQFRTSNASQPEEKQLSNQDIDADAAQATLREMSADFLSQDSMTADKIAEIEKDLNEQIGQLKLTSAEKEKLQEQVRQIIEQLNDKFNNQEHEDDLFEDDEEDEFVF